MRRQRGAALVVFVLGLGMAVLQGGGPQRSQPTHLAAVGSPVPAADVRAASTSSTSTTAATTTTEPATTTTEPPPPVVGTTVAPQGPPRALQGPLVATSEPPASASSGSGACGGDLPPCWVMRRESGGDPTAVNWTGCGGRGCYGKWQFDPRTAEAEGYPGRMDLQPESVQDDLARQVWAGGAGCSAWAAC